MQRGSHGNTGGYLEEGKQSRKTFIYKKVDTIPILTKLERLNRMQFLSQKSNTFVCIFSRPCTCNVPLVLNMLQFTFKEWLKLERIMNTQKRLRWYNDYETATIREVWKKERERERERRVICTGLITLNLDIASHENLITYKEEFLM